MGHTEEKHHKGHISCFYYCAGTEYISEVTVIKTNICLHMSFFDEAVDFMEQTSQWEYNLSAKYSVIAFIVALVAAIQYTRFTGWGGGGCCHSGYAVVLITNLITFTVSAHSDLSSRSE